MKRFFIQLALCLLAVTGYAQGDIHFTIQKSQTKGLSENVVDALDLKLHQVFNRNSAAAADVYNVFSIEPSLSLDEILSSEGGLVRDVALAKGELVLIAKNLIDGAEYYSVTIPVEGDAVGSKDKAMKEMVRNIKVTNPAFTRFIRTARQKIADYYAANCALILQKAQALYNQHRYQEAVNYLSAATSAMPCYDQAYALQKQILENLPSGPDTVYVDKVVERVIEKPVEKVIEKPVIVEKVIEKPVPVPAAKPATPATPDCDITISKNDLDFRIVSCKGNPQQKRITIVCEYVNRNNSIERGDIEFMTAFDENGKEYGRSNLSVNNANGSSYEWINMPARVNLKHDFYLVNYETPIKLFSYVKFKVRDGFVEIRNLPVQW